MNDSPKTILALQERIHRLEKARRPCNDRPFSSGSPLLDRLLPEAGFPRGSLVEWLAGEDGGGAATMAMLAAREATRQGGVLVVMDRLRQFYPPAAAALGIDLDKTVVIRTRCIQDEMWVLDQALRCRGVAAVHAAVNQLDWRWFRRLQLAVEQGGGLGLLVRPACVRGQPSWSQVQLLVHPRPSPGPRRLRVEVTRCRGSSARGLVELVIEDVTGTVRRHETHPLHLAAQLAHPTPHRRSARA
jgi:protein ImuA